MWKDALRKQLGVSDHYRMECERLTKHMHDMQVQADVYKAQIQGLEWQIDDLKQLVSDLFDVAEIPNIECATRCRHTEQCEERYGKCVLIDRMIKVEACDERIRRA